MIPGPVLKHVSVPHRSCSSDQAVAEQIGQEHSVPAMCLCNF